MSDIQNPKSNNATPSNPSQDKYSSKTGTNPQASQTSQQPKDAKAANLNKSDATSTDRSGGMQGEAEACGTSGNKSSKM